MSIPRNEYPRPQFVREKWMCLNGEWQFEIDQGDCGLERGLLDRDLTDTITVPFCPESKLSGIETHDFLNAVWYRRTVDIPEDWQGQRILLHFQAVDYDTTVWVNRREVKRHRGGFTPFTCDLSGVVQAGDSATIVVRARDYREPPQPRGKQDQRYHPAEALYSRTTGIWQTVWIEPVPDHALQRTRITPDVANHMFRIEQPVFRARPGLRLEVTLSDEQGAILTKSCPCSGQLTVLCDLLIPDDRLHLWSIEDPFLYDLDIRLLDENGNLIDSFLSYAGLRSIEIDGYAVKLNGVTVFQRLVLDQGYYPDGLMTAPSDADLIADIELSQTAGFNGARLHQKVFEERFLYHADRLGYLVWGEFGDWGSGVAGPEYDHQRPTASYITEWMEALERDYSHPSIVGWCPLNETWQLIGDHITDLDVVTQGMYLATKAFDRTRPVLDASGYSHRVAESDIYDSHDYLQDTDAFQKRHGGEERYINAPEPHKRYSRYPVTEAWSVPYDGQPYFLSEFGGIWWNPDAKEGEDSWGYGDRPRSIEAFYARFESMCATLLDNPTMFGYCYTQLTDVFQEQNGIYRFDRSEKFDMERIRRIQTKRAAIENTDK
ncbi:MAG: beta-galactosidase [Anaerolineaceae bacterium]|nr:beta-galactosidase [Anaerolineaceae bacterium]